MQAVGQRVQIREPSGYSISPSRLETPRPVSASPMISLTAGSLAQLARNFVGLCLARSTVSSTDTHVAHRHDPCSSFHEAPEDRLLTNDIPCSWRWLP